MVYLPPGKVIKSKKSTTCDFVLFAVFGRSENSTRLKEAKKIKTEKMIRRTSQRKRTKMIRPRVKNKGNKDFCVFYSYTFI